MADDPTVEHSGSTKEPLWHLPEVTNTAPVIFFDEVTMAGVRHSVCQITLEVAVPVVKDGKAIHGRVVMAHLRTTGKGWASLKEAVEKLALMVTPTPDKAS